jgi:hypothetical protein
VVEELCGDPGMDWYMSEFGGGVMVHELKFGLSFLHEREDSNELIDGEDLVLISRGQLQLAIGSKRTAGGKGFREVDLAAQGK